MKRFNRSILVLVLACFLLNTACADYAAALAPSLVLDDITDGTPHAKNIALAEMRLAMDLEELDSLSDIDGANDINVIREAFRKSKRLKSNSFYREYPIENSEQITAYFNAVTALGNYLFFIPVSVEKQGKRYDYQLVFSALRKQGESFPAGLYEKDQFERSKAIVIKSGRPRTPGKSPEDAKAVIALYLLGEETFTAARYLEEYAKHFEGLGFEKPTENTENALRTVRRDLNEDASSLVKQGYLEILSEAGVNGEYIYKLTAEGRTVLTTLYAPAYDEASEIYSRLAAIEALLKMGHNRKKILGIAKYIADNRVEPTEKIIASWILLANKEDVDGRLAYLRPLANLKEARPDVNALSKAALISCGYDIDSLIDELKALVVDIKYIRYVHVRHKPRVLSALIEEGRYSKEASEVLLKRIFENKDIAAIEFKVGAAEFLLRNGIDIERQKAFLDEVAYEKNGNSFSLYIRTRAMATLKSVSQPEIKAPTSPSEEERTAEHEYALRSIKAQPDILDDMRALDAMNVSRVRAGAAILANTAKAAELQKTSLLDEAVSSLPREWNENGMDTVYLFAELRTLLDHPMPMTDKTGLIFSEKVAFDNGLGVLLPKLSQNWNRVGVVATTDHQRSLIDQLNEGKVEGERIVYAQNPEAVRAKLGAPHAYYFKVSSDVDTGSFGGITVFDITATIKKIIEALGAVVSIAESSQSMSDLYRATEKFIKAAA